MIRFAQSPVAFRLAVAALVCQLAAAAPAGAHGQTSPIEADSVRVQTTEPPDGVAFEFSSTDSGALVPAHDPAIEGSALLVRGVGENAGRTALISFDPAHWAPTANGFGYTDATGSRGGVTSVVYENGNLSISASAEGWGWSPAGPQDEVWVHFRVEDEWLCARFSEANATVESNAAGHFAAAEATAPGACPAQVCGNGLQEVGEACDDGNLAEGDGCDPDCTIGVCNAETFASTFEGIQKVVFESEAYGCGRGTCHDSVLPDGDLDLSHDAAYESLLGLDGLGAQASAGNFLRVLPTEPSQSLLFLKLASKKDYYTGPDVGSPMPTGLAALSDDHLEAVSLWIRGGAPRDRVVEGTAQLLGTCFPPADPLKTPVPDPPAPEMGFQLQQTPYPLVGVNTGNLGETELCMTTYYDLSSRAPESVRIPCPPDYQYTLGCAEDHRIACEVDADCVVQVEGGEPENQGPCIGVKNVLNPENECIAYDRLTVLQDPQSHHSILGNYTGSSDMSDPCWGSGPGLFGGGCPTAPDAWTYKFEPDDPRSVNNGTPCDPTAVDPVLGVNPGCSSKPIESIACIGYGPQDLGNLSLLTGTGGNYPQFSVSQETYFDFRYPAGVYNVMPIKGAVIWNSHAFNLTTTDSTMAQFLNVEYAPANEREHASVPIFDARYILHPFVPPFETRELCATFTAPRGANIFQLSSHTHRHGTRWRTWGPPNTPCQPACTTAEEDPITNYVLKVIGFCGNNSLPICEGPREDAPIYFSSDYSDPLYLDVDPPMQMDSPDDADRTFLYCAVFDNGATESSPVVKQHQYSPTPPTDFGFGPFFSQAFGGPCAEANRECLAGPNKGVTCGFEEGPADHAMCDTFPGAGDGECQACPVHGGVTTEDEMFILMGSYYMTPVPEPGALGLGAAAIAAIGALARRRSR